MDCVFCKIAAKEIPAEIVYEDAAVVAFRDLNPQAPTHVLIIPRHHVEGLHEASGDDDLQAVLLAAAEVARREGVDKTGYRVVLNSGQQAGQTVFHLHAHLLGGRQMHWPPG